MLTAILVCLFIVRVGGEMVASRKRKLVDALLAQIEAKIPGPVEVAMFVGGDFGDQGARAQELQDRAARQRRENELRQQMEMLGNGHTYLLDVAVVVRLGAIVTFRYPGEEPRTMFILPTAEGEVLPGGVVIVTSKSPLVRALMGHKAEEIVPVPNGSGGTHLITIISVQ